MRVRSPGKRSDDAKPLRTTIVAGFIELYSQSDGNATAGSDGLGCLGARALPDRVLFFLTGLCKQGGEDGCSAFMFVVVAMTSAVEADSSSTCRVHTHHSPPHRRAHPLAHRLAAASATHTRDSPADRNFATWRIPSLMSPPS